VCAVRSAHGTRPDGHLDCQGHISQFMQTRCCITWPSYTGSFQDALRKRRPCFVVAILVSLSTALALLLQHRRHGLLARLPVSHGLHVVNAAMQLHLPDPSGVHARAQLAARIVDVVSV
jgi:hypothetical protein